MYDVSLKRKWDAYTVHQNTIQDIQKAREEGIEKGIAEGMEKGRLEERVKNDADMRRYAFQLKGMGMSAQDIAKAFDITVDQASNLLK